MQKSPAAFSKVIYFLFVFGLCLIDISSFPPDPIRPSPEWTQICAKLCWWDAVNWLGTRALPHCIRPSADGGSGNHLFCTDVYIFWVRVTQGRSETIEPEVRPMVFLFDDATSETKWTYKMLSWCRWLSAESCTVRIVNIILTYLLTYIVILFNCISDVPPNL